jgi:hypothetical protein
VVTRICMPEDRWRRERKTDIKKQGTGEGTPIHFTWADGTSCYRPGPHGRRSGAAGPTLPWWRRQLGRQRPWLGSFMPMAKPCGRQSCGSSCSFLIVASSNTTVESCRSVRGSPLTCPVLERCCFSLSLSLYPYSFYCVPCDSLYCVSCRLYCLPCRHPAVHKCTACPVHTFLPAQHTLCCAHVLLPALHTFYCPPCTQLIPTWQVVPAHTCLPRALYCLPCTHLSPGLFALYCLPSPV